MTPFLIIDTATTGIVELVRYYDGDATGCGIACHRPARYEPPIEEVLVPISAPGPVDDVDLSPQPRFSPPAPQHLQLAPLAAHRPASLRPRHRPWAAALRCWSGR